MSWMKASPPPAIRRKRSGVMASAVQRKTGDIVVRVTLSAAAQEQYFGGSLAGSDVAVEIGRVEHEGKLRIQKCAGGGGLKVGGKPGKAATVVIAAWAKHIAPAPKAASCQPHWDGQALVVVLPEWAGPQAVRQQMDAEFGLRKG